MQQHPDPRQNLARLLGLLVRAGILPEETEAPTDHFQAGYLVLSEWLESVGCGLTELILTVKRFKERWNIETEDQSRRPVVSILQGARTIGITVVYFAEELAYVPSLDIWIKRDPCPVTIHTFDVTRAVELSKPLAKE